MTYSDEVKAAAMAALLQGQAVSQVAKDYHLPEGTVKSWKHRNQVSKLVAEIAPQKREIGDLIIQYLQANLEALKAQAIVFADPEWLKKHEASQLAILHGVMTDKAIRLLEAMSRDDNPSDQPESKTASG